MLAPADVLAASHTRAPLAGYLSDLHLVTSRIPGRRHKYMRKWSPNTQVILSGMPHITYRALADRSTTSFRLQKDLDYGRSPSTVEQKKT